MIDERNISEVLDDEEQIALVQRMVTAMMSEANENDVAINQKTTVFALMFTAALFLEPDVDEPTAEDVLDVAQGPGNTLANYLNALRQVREQTGKHPFEMFGMSASDEGPTH